MSVDRDGEGGRTDAERLYVAEREEERMLTKLHKAEVEAERRKFNRNQPTVGLWAAVAMIAFPENPEVADRYDTEIGHEQDAKRSRRPDVMRPSLSSLPGAVAWSELKRPEDATRKNELLRQWVSEQESNWAAAEDRLTTALRLGSIKAFGPSGPIAPGWWMTHTLHGAANCSITSLEVQTLRFSRADVVALVHVEEIREWHGWMATAPMQRGAVSFSEIGAALSLAGYATDLDAGCRFVIAAFDAGLFQQGDGSSAVIKCFEQTRETFAPTDFEPVKRSMGFENTDKFGPMFHNGPSLREDLLDYLFVPIEVVERWFVRRGWEWSLERFCWYSVQPKPVLEALPNWANSVPADLVPITQDIPKAKKKGGRQPHPAHARFIQEVVRVAEYDGLQSRRAIFEHMTDWVGRELEDPPDDRTIRRWLERSCPDGLPDC